MVTENTERHGDHGATGARGTKTYLSWSDACSIPNTLKKYFLCLLRLHIPASSVISVALRVLRDNGFSFFTSWLFAAVRSRAFRRRRGPRRGSGPRGRIRRGTWHPGRSSPPDRWPP